MHWMRLTDRAFDAARDRARKHGLRGPRHVLEQHVAAAGERAHCECDGLRLAEDDGLDIAAKLSRLLCSSFERR